MNAQTAFASGRFLIGGDLPVSRLGYGTCLLYTSAFFGSDPVSLIDEGKIDNYKAWRANEHEVRDITIRHDLHALSKFFGYAIRQHWTFTNPIRGVEIPSDANAVRMHILTPAEEQDYFCLLYTSPRKLSRDLCTPAV